MAQTSGFIFLVFVYFLRTMSIGIKDDVLNHGGYAINIEDELFHHGVVIKGKMCDS